MNGQMIKKLKQMQEEILDAQKKLENTEFEGSSSGVKVVVLGNKMVMDLSIPEEMKDDIETIQDTVIIAINDAMKKIDQEHERVMSKFQMPGLPF